MIQFFKHSVEKRHSKLGKLRGFRAIIPEMFSEHCRKPIAARLRSGRQLSHLYELKQLLLAGLEGQLLLACKSGGLRKIQLRHGRWYDAGDADGEQKLKFDRR